eukprot:jgi/Bigna1/137574/aug1.40_g12282
MCRDAEASTIVSEEAEWRDFKDSDPRGGDPDRVGLKEDGIDWDTPKLHFADESQKVHEVIQPSKVVTIQQSKKANKLGLENSVGQEAAKIAEAVMLTGCLGGKRPGTVASYQCLLAH